MILGDICWVEFPARGGHAQAGRRPAIVAQSSSDVPTVLLIPPTTQQDALRLSGTVLLEPDQANHLRRPSVELIFQLTAVDRRYVAGQLGSVSEAKLNEIWNEFDVITGRKQV